MFAKALLVGLLAAVAAAQSTTLYFTRVPSPITAGQAQALTYATGDASSPVTILLRKGVSTDLQTIATLTTTATNGQYIWNVEKSLPNGSDYALEIKQGNEVNYFGPFEIQGGGQAGSSSSSSSAAEASGYGSVSSSSSAIATITASSNSSAIATATISAGTGYSMPRNQTMSSATLTSPATDSATATANTNAAGFQGSKTSASAPASTGAASSLIATSSSAVALVLGAAAAFFFC